MLWDRCPTADEIAARKRLVRRSAWSVAAALAIGALTWKAVTAPDGVADPTAANAHLAHGAVVMNSALLVFREGLEAVLVLAAFTASFVGANRGLRKPVAAGAGVALLASVVTWFVAIGIIGALGGPGLDVQAGTGLLAVGVLLVVMNWFFHKVYWTGWISAHNRKRRALLSGAAGAPHSGSAILGFTSVYREGFEIVLFLQNLRIKAGDTTVLEGVALGLAFTGVVGVVTFVLQHKLPYKRMLVATGVLLGFVLLVMVGESIQEMQLAGWLPTHSIGVSFPGFVGAVVRDVPDGRGHRSSDRRGGARDRLVLPRRARSRRRAARTRTRRAARSALRVGVAPAPENPARMRRRELDSRLLIMVTLALVAFGLVMVYSATSAAAAVGGNDPSYYLKRQGIYAALGIVLMIVAQRWDYRRLKPLAPALVLTSFVLLVAVLAIGPPVNGARRWISLGPAVFQPSELAKLALAVWASAYFAKRKPPRDLKELWRPVGALTCVFAALLVLEPDLGTTIALFLMLVGILVVVRDPGARRPLGGRHRIGRGPRRDLDEAVQPHALLRVPAPGARRGRDRLPDPAGADRHGLRRHVRRRARAGDPEDLLPPRGAHRHDAREHRRGARARRRHRRDRRLRTVRVRRPRHRDALQGPVRQAARRRDHRARLRAGRDQHPGGHGRRAADRHPAAVPLLRRVELDRSPRRCRDSP